MSTVADLLREVRALEVVARKNVSAQLAGNYLTSIPGRGIDFYEARHYVQGEPIRQIDWKITARMGTPYVKTYLEERQRELFIVLDISPSMFSGWQRQTKLETAVELAATLALSAVAAGDRIGLVTFADQVTEQISPGGGRKHLYRILESLVSTRSGPPAQCDQSDPRVAIHAIQRFKGRRFVVFIISDFIDHNVPEDIRFVQRKHDVSLLHVYDPIEYLADAPLLLPAIAAEGRRRRPTLLRLGETGSLEEMLNFLRAAAIKRNIDLGSLSTREPIGGWLNSFFHAKRRRVL